MCTKKFPCGSSSLGWVLVTYNQRSETDAVNLRLIPKREIPEKEVCVKYK